MNGRVPGRATDAFGVAAPTSSRALPALASEGLARARKQDPHPEAVSAGEPLRRPLPRGHRIGTELSSLVFPILLIAIWSLLIRKLGSPDVFWVLGVYGLATSGIAIVMRRREGRGILLDRPEEAPGIHGRSALRRWSNAILAGLGVGAVMTLGTYYAYDLAAILVPPLAERVAGLYRASRTTSFGAAFAWTLVVLATEELLWRGLVLDRASRLWGVLAGGAFSVVTYTLAQLGSGSVVLALAAFVCGIFWTIERRLTRSLVAPLLSHAIWTLTIVLIHPIHVATAGG